MRKVRILVAAAVLSVATAGLAAPPAHACMGELCDAINFVCEKTITKGHACVK
jgi:hypothetical protein